MWLQQRKQLSPESLNVLHVAWVGRPDFHLAPTIHLVDKGGADTSHSTYTYPCRCKPPWHATHVPLAAYVGAGAHDDVQAQLVCELHKAHNVPCGAGKVIDAREWLVPVPGNVCATHVCGCVAGIQKAHAQVVMVLSPSARSFVSRSCQYSGWMRK